MNFHQEKLTVLFKPGHYDVLYREQDIEEYPLLKQYDVLIEPLKPVKEPPKKPILPPDPKPAQPKKPDPLPSNELKAPLLPKKKEEKNNNEHKGNSKKPVKNVKPSKGNNIEMDVIINMGQSTGKRSQPLKSWDSNQMNDLDLNGVRHCKLKIFLLVMALIAVSLLIYLLCLSLPPSNP